MTTATHATPMLPLTALLMKVPIVTICGDCYACAKLAVYDDECDVY